MVRSKDLQKVRKDIDHFRKQIKIAQNRLFRSWDIARSGPLDNNTCVILERKEKHYRAMKRRLAGMEESLRALQEGSFEPETIKPWKIERPTTESRLINFCEA